MLLWLLFKVIGVVMIAVGGFLVIFFPGVPRHQEGAGGQYTNFAASGIVLGLILIIVGGFILFSP